MRAARLAALPSPVLMLLATLLFSAMGLCVKLASAHYPLGDIILARGSIGALMLVAVARLQGGSLRTSVPGMHAWRCAVGVTSLSLWFYSFGGLPLATATTLNYMSSVWMALFLIGGAVILGGARVDGRLVATVLIGFLGVGLVLRPTIGQDQAWYAICGLLSGMLSAIAYLQVAALGRTGEPSYRIVFYFSIGNMVVGALLMAVMPGERNHSVAGLALLLAVGVLATLAQLLMTHAYTHGRPLVNASLQYLAIVFSFIFGVTIFNDPVTWMAVAGMLLIVLAGLAATLLRQRVAPKVTSDSPVSES